jgi:hypothetical protein
VQEIISFYKEDISATSANKPTTPAIAIFSISISLLIPNRYHPTKAFLTTTGTPLAKKYVGFCIGLLYEH